MPDSLRALWLLFAFSFRNDPRGTILSLLLAIIWPLSFVATSVGLKLLVDAVLRHDPGGLWIAALVVAVGGAAWPLAIRAFGQVAATARERLSAALDAQLIAFSSGVPGIEHHERPD
jgi:ATP-binding cassette subfamily B protein